MANKVPKRHYTLNNVREILGDSTIPSRHTRGGLLHRSPSVDGSYADAVYCPGADDAERANAILQDTDNSGAMHGRYWRNYGPNDDDIPVEIHFANMLDRDNVEHIDTGVDLTDKYVLHYSHPPIANIEAYTSSDYPYVGAFGTIPSSYFDPNIPDDFGNHKLALKVGFNQSGLSKDNVKYGVKVTTYLGADYDIDASFNYESGGTKTVNPWATVSGVGISSGTTLVAYKAGILGKFTGGLQAQAFGISQSMDAFGLISGVVGVASGIGLFIAMIQVADLFMDMAQNASQLKDGEYHYNRLTQGLYNKDDVKDSLVKVGIGTQHQNTINDFGTHKPIVSFESGDVAIDIVDDKAKHFINLDFNPKGTQYDLATPPPMVYYKVELVPISGCKLSTTKPTIIGISMLPYKYEAPKFGISPDYLWNYGSMAKFMNAKYCDYIALKDLDNAGILNQYHHQYIGTWGNEAQGQDKYPRNIVDKTLILPITDLFTLGNFLNGTFMGTALYSGKYEVIFAKDKFEQLVFNWEFTNRQGSGDPGLNMVKQYWTLGTGWVLNNSSLIKNGGAESITYQDVYSILESRNHRNSGRKMYLMDIDVVVTSGTFYIDVADVFYVAIYDRAIIDFYGGDMIDAVDLPAGIAYDDANKRILITQTMRFFYMLKAEGDLQQSRIKLGATTDSVVTVKHCKCKRISNQEGLEGTRITPLANFPILVDTTPAPNELVLTVDTLVGESINFDLADYTEIGDDLKSVTIDYGDGTITNEVVADIVTGTSHSHTYETEGVYTIRVLLDGYSNVGEFTCNSPILVGVKDDASLLYDGIVNLNSTSINKPYVVNIDSSGVTYEQQPLFNMFTQLNSLYCTDNPYLTEDLSTWAMNVTDNVDLSNTEITGDIGNLKDTKLSITLTNTFAITYSGVYTLDCKVITWYTQDLYDNGNKIIISESATIRLLNDLDVSGVTDGTLTIGNDNEGISNPEALDDIDSLIAKNWTIFYNPYELSPYGLMYSWGTVDDVRGITSNDNWFVPSSTQYSNLITYLGGVNVAGGKLKEVGLIKWNTPNTGATNSLLFSGIGSGKRNHVTGDFENLNISGNLHASDDFNSSNSYHISLNYDSTVASVWYSSKKLGLGVRLASNAIGIADGVTTIYTGNDGKTYKAIAINGIYWTIENLEETKFRTGDIIPYIANDADWSTAGSALCVYDNNLNYALKSPRPVISSEHGLLYNGYVVQDVRGIARDGWRVMTSDDFSSLATYANNDGKLLQLDSATQWLVNVGTNDFGLSLIGSGWRRTNGTFQNLTTSCQLGINTGLGRKSITDDGTIGNNSEFVNTGLTYRLTKDAPGISDGTSIIYTGNDGKVYYAVAINEIYYLIENLQETQFNDNSLIPYIVDDTTWGNATGPALSVYGNYIYYATKSPQAFVISAELGLLYNSDVVFDSKKINSSDDWTVPTKVQIDGLVAHVGGGDLVVANNALRSSISGAWTVYPGTDTHGFNQYGIGSRHPYDGTFAGKGNQAHMWSSTIDGSTKTYKLQLFDDNTRGVSVGAVDNHQGDCIRLVKNATGVPDGTITTYTGNDDKVYYAISINGLYWLIENLQETEFRDNSLITYIEDNTDWFNSIDSAICVYDHDLNYATKLPQVVIPYTGPVMITGTEYNAERFHHTTDLIAWTAQNIGYATNMVRGITFGNNIWVAGGYFPDASWNDKDSLMYSSDGINWTGLGATSVALMYQANGVVFANNQFIAVGSSGSNSFATSPDGINWTGRGTNVLDARDIAYGNGIFATVGRQSGDGYVYTSIDNGVTWISKGSKFSYIGSCIAYGNGRWMIGGGDTNQLAYSDDNFDTVNYVGTSIFTNCYGIATNGAGTWVAVGVGTNTLAYSDDNGATWNGLAKTNFPSTGWKVKWYDGKFYAVGSGSPGDGVISSADGITWVKATDDITPPTMVTIGTI